MLLLECPRDSASATACEQRDLVFSSRSAVSTDHRMGGTGVDGRQHPPPPDPPSPWRRRYQEEEEEERGEEAGGPVRLRTMLKKLPLSRDAHSVGFPVFDAEK